ARRNRDYSYTMPKKAVRAAIRMAILSKFQDNQALVVEGLAPAGPDATPKTREVAKALAAIRRPDLDGDATVAPAEGETKTAARRRSLATGTVLLGLPANDPTLYRSARNLEGVQVAPVAEFNTYDVLKQRYLVLTREAFAALKERVKQPVDRRPARTASTPT